MPADYERCQVVLAFHVDSGAVDATASRVDAFGLQFDNTGKNGHSAPFSWAA